MRGHLFLILMGGLMDEKGWGVFFFMFSLWKDVFLALGGGRGGAKVRRDEGAREEKRREKPLKSLLLSLLSFYLISCSGRLCCFFMGYK